MGDPRVRDAGSALRKAERVILVDQKRVAQVLLQWAPLGFRLFPVPANTVLSVYMCAYRASVRV